MGSPTTDLPVWSLYIPRQVDDALAGRICRLCPDISDREAPLVLEAFRALVASDMEIRRARLPALWEASANCKSRQAATAEQRLSRVQDLLRRRRSAASELLEHENTGLAALLAKELGEERADQIGSRVRALRELDQDRLAGALLPMARIDVLEMLGSFMAGCETGADRDGLPLELPSLDTQLQELRFATVAWERSRDAAIIQDERYRSEMESLPARSPDNEEALATVRSELRTARRGILSRMAASEERIAKARLQLLESLCGSVSAACANKLRAAIFAAAYGPAVVDPWDLRSIVEEARVDWGLDEELAETLAVTSEQSRRQTEDAVRIAIDAYWLERVKTFSATQEANAACVGRIQEAFEAARARMAVASDVIAGEVRGNTVDAARDRLERWRRQCESEQKARIESLGLWRARDATNR